MTKFSEHDKSKYWDYQKNNKKPKDVTYESKDKFWFKCDKCPHSFEISIKEVVAGKWCKYCSNGVWNKLCIQEDCNYCYNRSFASHEKSVYWSKDNDTNPRNVFRSVAKKYLFNCECAHTILISLNKITSHNCWCAYCSNSKLCDDENCKTCFEKSFASNEKSKYWSKQNDINPRQVFKSAGKKYLFNCECGHNFIAIINNINNGRWCAYCSNNKLCDDDNCKICFEKSFASHEKVKYFNTEKNDIIPRMLFKGSDKVCWFICENGHEFCNRIQRITYEYNMWCQVCPRKSETKLYEWLKKCYPEIVYQARFDWCKNIRNLSFDFYIPSKNILIELDGDQHFKDVKYWDSNYKEVQQRDAIKLIEAIKNNMYVIHIYQPDVLYDKLNWKAILYYLIEYKSSDYFLSTISSDPKIYENYICEGISKLACDD